MASTAESFYRIKFNPFVAGPVLWSFYNSLGKVDGSLLYAQIVLPLISHPVYRGKLMRAQFGRKKRSSLPGIFDSRPELADLQERVDDLKDVTRLSVLHACNNSWLVLHVEKLALSCGEMEPSGADMGRSAKIAGKLGSLINGASVVECFAYLGIKKL